MRRFIFPGSTNYIYLYKLTPSGDSFWRSHNSALLSYKNLRHGYIDKHHSLDSVEIKERKREMAALTAALNPNESYINALIDNYRQK